MHQAAKLQQDELIQILKKSERLFIKNYRIAGNDSERARTDYSFEEILNTYRSMIGAKKVEEVKKHYNTLKLK